jgi:hypothetical protein
MSRLSYLLLAVLFLHGCTLTGQEFSSSAIKAIQPNVTTKEQITKTFGEPYRKGLESGFETRIYRYRAIVTEKGGYVNKDLFLIFNKNGTVQKYSFQTNLPKGEKLDIPGSTGSPGN